MEPYIHTYIHQGTFDSLTICFFNLLLETESSSRYFCSVPLNIIISVDNYTLRNGTEQSLVMAKQLPTIGILVSFSAWIVRKYVLLSLRPSLRLSVLMRFFYTQFHIHVTRSSAYSFFLPFIPLVQ